jgi:hypothetical protein
MAEIEEEFYKSSESIQGISEFRICSPTVLGESTKSLQKKVDGPSIPSPVEEIPLDQRWGSTKSTLTKSRRQQ